MKNAASELRIAETERRGAWAYYWLNSEALKELSAWLS